MILRYWIKHFWSVWVTRYTVQPRSHRCLLCNHMVSLREREVTDIYFFLICCSEKYLSYTLFKKLITWNASVTIHTRNWNRDKDEKFSLPARLQWTANLFRVKNLKSRQNNLTILRRYISFCFQCISPNRLKCFLNPSEGNISVWP
jgi:hypothetical protein